MKILFVMASAEYLRYYDSTIRLLASRGHEVLIAVNHDRGDKKPVKLDELVSEAQESPARARQHPPLDTRRPTADARRPPVDAPPPTPDGRRPPTDARPPTADSPLAGRISVAGVLPTAAPFWGRTARGLRGTMDFVRYYDPHFAEARALRARIKRKVLPGPLHVLDRVPRLTRRATRAIVAGLASLERAIPTVRPLEEWLASMRPDVILVSPLVDAASPQVDVVKSAQRLGIPVAAGIASWDNLTNKGLLRIEPDLVIVWNEIQKEEAASLHFVAPERVVVTGAQLFDRWFGREPTRGAEEFCRMVGFSGATPYALFTCSSGFISEGQAEVAFVRRWIQALRRGGSPTVAALPVLVRPHPYNTRAWSEADLSDLQNVVVWPRGPYNPVSDEGRAGFFDSLYHSAAVVGINTSAMIEAAIVGRPVLSIRAEEFAATQDGTLHFHYLLPENGGFLRVADTLAEHTRQLDEVLAHAEVTQEQLRRFVDAFIRPRGRAVAATPVVADTLEALAARGAKRRGAGAAIVLRPMMWALAVAAAAAEAGTGDAWHRARKSVRMRWHRARKKMAKVTGAAIAGR